MTKLTEKDWERELSEICTAEQCLLEKRMAAIPDLPVSPGFQRKMKRLFFRRKLRYDVLFNTAGKKVAAVFLCVLLAGATTVMSVDALRDGFFSLIESIFCQYQEQPSIQSDQISSMLYHYDGKIVWEQTTETGSAFVDDTGKKYLEIPKDVPGFAALDFDGNLMMVDLNSETCAASITRYTAAGNVEYTVKLNDLPRPAEGEYLEITKVLADQDFLYLLVQTDSAFLQVYDWDGNLIAEYAETVDVTIDGEGNFYSLTGDLQNHTPYAILKGDMKNHVESTKMPVYGYFLQIDYNRADGNLYLASAQEVSVHRTLDGKKLRTVLTIGQDTSFYPESVPGCYDFAVAEDQSLYFNFCRYSENFQVSQEIIPFRFDTKAAPEQVQPDIAITVPYASDYLRDAVMRYEREHPGTEVMIDTEYSSWEEWHTSGLPELRGLQTRLAAGTVGNLVQISNWSGQSVRDNLDSELLLDLTPYIQESGLQTSMNPAVLQGMETDGTVRGIPTGYQASCLAVNAELAEKLGVDLESLTSWAEIFDLLPLLEEQAPGTLLFSCTRDGVLSAFLRSSLPKLTNPKRGTVSLEQEWFQKDLEALCRVWQNPNFAALSEDFQKDPLKNSLFTVLELGEGAALMDDFTQASDYYPNHRFLPMPGAGIYQPREVYAIPANAPYPEKAWDFLEYLASDEMQSLSSQIDIPVQQAGWDAFTKQTSYFSAPSDKQRLHDFERVAKNAETMGVPDSMEKTVSAAIRQYLNGKQTMEEALHHAEEQLSDALH